MDNNDYIFRYFNHELSDQERIEFEQRCKTDDGFAQEVALFLQTKELAKQQLKADFKQSYRKTKRNRKWLIFMAVFWILAAIGFLIYDNFNNNEEPEELTPELIFAQLTPPLSEVRSSENNTTVDILDVYQNQEYDSLIAIANTYDLDSIDNLNWVIIKALSEFGIGNYTGVIQTVDNFKNAHPNNAILEGERLWIQALAYWKLNNLDSAKANWQVIIDEDYKYKKQAEELVKSKSK